MRSGLTLRHFKIFEHYSSDRNMNEVFATNANIQRDRKNTSLSPVLSVGAVKKKKKSMSLDKH